jgi:hypothetical protein
MLKCKEYKVKRGAPKQEVEEDNGTNGIQEAAHLI